MKKTILVCILAAVLLFGATGQVFAKGKPPEPPPSWMNHPGWPGLANYAFSATLNYHGWGNAVANWVIYWMLKTGSVPDKWWW